MKIAVNTRLLLSNKLEGIGWFSFEILKRMVINHPEDEFIFIFDRPYDEKFVFAKNVTPIVIGPQARHPILFRIWFNWSVTSILKKHQPNVFLSPDGYLSLRTNVPSVAVIHDLNFEHYPNDLKKIHSKYYKKYFPLFAKKAKRIATVSEFSKGDISKLYNIDPKKIDVIYNGVGDGFFPSNCTSISEVKKKYTQGHDYFLFVGALHPRKNIGRLLQAFDLFKEKATNNTKLVIVGEKHWWNDDLEKTFNEMTFSVDVIFTGRKSQEELNRIYGGAIALCFVPYFEGFGIPILEGFKCEIAVITSNITSMPEVAGEAAYLIDPFNIDSIEKAMSDLANDEILRQDFIEKGKKQAAKFSWDHSAEKMWDVIKKRLMAKLKLYHTKGIIEAGCDEAGRGCLAGPVVAAAVILPARFKLLLLDDSKKLTEKQREKLRPIIEEKAISWGIGIVDHHEIDEINILNASFLAMHRAIDNLSQLPDELLIDGNRFNPYKEISHHCMIKGDARFMSIAAASVLAKTYRDDLMKKLDLKYPEYLWRKNKGYPTKEHRNAIRRVGISPFHRKTFQLLPKS